MSSSLLLADVALSHSYCTRLPPSVGQNDLVDTSLLARHGMSHVCKDREAGAISSMPSLTTDKVQAYLAMSLKYIA